MREISLTSSISEDPERICPERREEHCNMTGAVPRTLENDFFLLIYCLIRVS